MKSSSIIKSFGVACLLVPSLLHAAPAEIARESFEGTVGEIGYTPSVTEFEISPTTKNDFFKVVANNGSKLVGGTISGGDGLRMFAAEDIDTIPASLVPTQWLTTNAVTITGKTNTSVKILLAAPGTGPAVGGNQNEYDHSATASVIDFVRVEASVDGSPFNRLIQYSPILPSTTSLDVALGLDSDGNGLADSSTTNLLTASFREFDLPFPSGSSVQIRVVMHSNATDEYICVDNIRIFGESTATAAPVISVVPTAALSYTEGDPATPLAPALTVTDADSTTLPSASVVISQNLSASEDSLTATPSGAVLAGDIVYTSATGTLAITRSASLADYQAVLRSVRYLNSNVSNPNTAVRQIRFSTTDGATPSNQPIRTVAITDNIATQVLPFTESFETDGRGTRYALDGRFSLSSTAFFDRSTPTGLTNLDGTQAIVAEDTLLDSAAPLKALRLQFNTAGYSSTTATVRLGTASSAAFDTNDYIFIEASVNGGSFTALTNGVFQSTAFNGALAIDTNNDGIGDGTTLGTAMQDFTLSLPTANTLTLRVRCQSNVAGERIIVDRINVTGVLPTTVASVNSSTANGSFKTGDAVSIQVNFTAAVTVTGTPQLTLETGATDRVANYASGSGTSTLTFNYTVQAGDVSSDLDYASTSALALNGGTIQSASVNALLTLAAPSTVNSLGANKAIVIDGVRPVLASAITVSDTALKIGDTATVSFTFAEAVSGFTNADLTIANGTLSAVSTSNGGIAWTATLTPSVSTTDTTNTITLDYTGITDTAGNTGTGSAASPNYAIDTVRPTLASAIIVSDTALKIGDTATVTFTFTEATSGLTTADLTIENGGLSALASSDGGITWTATLTPSASSTDASNIITLDSTGIADSAGNAGTGSVTSPNYAIDTVRPTVGIFVADTSLTAGETSLVTFTFSEAISGFTNADLTVSNGTLANVNSSNGGITFTATLTPSADVSDTTNVINLANTGLTDIAGNAGTGTTDSNNYAIDTTTVSILADATSANEGTGSGNTAFTFTVSRTGPTTAPTTVNYAASGAAVTATDFGGTLPSGSVIIPIGQVSAVLTINVSKDNLVELSEAFTVTLTSPSSGSLGTATASQTITNDDSSIITFTGPSINEGDTGTSSFNFGISLSNPVDTAISFNGATLGTGTATAGTDFTAIAPTSINIASGTATGSLLVTVTGDRLTELDETLIAQLSNLAASGRNVIFNGSVTILNTTGTIQNDDPAIVPGLASLNLSKGISGKLLHSTLIAAATGGEGPLTITAVQSALTAGGGTVSNSDGWITYQPTASFTGVDSFTYTLNDGFNNVNGTVSVVISATTSGQTMNILGITSEGTGKRVVAMGIPGRIYQFQISNDLVTWISLGSSITCPPSGILDTLDAGPLPLTRFYRMSEAP